MIRRVLALVVATAAAAPAAAQQPFTIAQVLSAPFPTELTAARTGAVAWVFNAEGVRNVWVAEPPSYQARRVTSYARDDGQEIGALQFTPDGTGLVYVRGGAPNRSGELPNPSSDPGGVERAIWYLRIAGGAPRKLATGAGPVISPNGRDVAFTAGTIQAVSLDSGATPRVLVRARGGLGSLRWSPDGDRLAFTSARGRHTLVGVYDLDAKVITWLDPSVDQDGQPAWSPDGSQVAFLRIPTAFTDRLFVAEREGEPWSIRVASVVTGRGREVWRADRGRGSVFRGVVADNQLTWSADGQLVFPWEKDGWTHLYSIPAAGGAAVLLTPGEGEVEHVSLSPDRRAVLYSANIGDIDRRDLWMVAAAGGAPRQLTRGTGIEWSPVMTGDGSRVALLRSDARMPARPGIMAAAGGPVQDLAPGAIPAGFPTAAMVEPQAVMLDAADGMKIPAQLFLPRDLRPGERRPAAIFFHGGSRRQMLLGWNYSNYYHKAYALSQYFASRGYVALSVNYRSGIGYGMEFREALNYGANGASEFNDVVGAGLYLRGRPDVDPGRVVLWGGSYGGYLTAMGLSRASDLFAAGVDIHGVHDWNPVIRGFIPAYDPLRNPEFARRAFASSPMSSLDGWRSPVLLIHADDDRNVPFTETGALVEELRKRGVEFETLVFPDDVHDFLRHANWVRAYEATADFFRRKLGR